MSFDFWIKWIQKGAIFFQVLLAPTGAIFGGVNNEMVYTLMSKIHSYKYEVKEHVRG